MKRMERERREGNRRERHRSVGVSWLILIELTTYISRQKGFRSEMKGGNLDSNSFFNQPHPLHNLTRPYTKLTPACLPPLSSPSSLHKCLLHRLVLFDVQIFLSTSTSLFSSLSSIQQSRPPSARQLIYSTCTSCIPASLPPSIVITRSSPLLPSTSRSPSRILVLLSHDGCSRH